MKANQWNMKLDEDKKNQNEQTKWKKQWITSRSTSQWILIRLKDFDRFDWSKWIAGIVTAGFWLESQRQIQINLSDWNDVIIGD